MAFNKFADGVGEPHGKDSLLSSASGDRQYRTDQPVVERNFRGTRKEFRLSSGAQRCPSNAPDGQSAW